MRRMILAVWLLQVVANPQETPHLQLKTSAKPAAGRRITLQIDVTPKSRMHVYAPGQDGYIPIQLTLTPSPAFTAARAKYPAGEKFVMPAINETQLVYAKPFTITEEITLTAAATVTVKGNVRYQACDDAICYLPKTVAVEWTVSAK
jgi:DsbC/DsbD-like thiol-disulfide interchange protein